MTEVVCPACLDRIDLELEKTKYELGDADFSPVKEDTKASPFRRDFDRQFTWKRCPNKLDVADHYWPTEYSQFNPPLVIGFVGGTNKGKTHLLAAMMGGLDDRRLLPIGLDVRWLDPDRHRTYMNEHVRPFLRDRRRIERTPVIPDGRLTDYVDVFLVTRGEYRRTVVFYDVRGGYLTESRHREADFMFAVDALLFVVDIGQASDPRSVDESFAIAMDRLEVRERNGLSPGRELPAAMILAKADERQFERPVLRWMRRPDLAAFTTPDNPDADAITRESADAYGFLHKNGFERWLDPVDYFDRITLHFASAAGSAVKDTTFPRDVGPRRALDPLASLFAMAGVLGETSRDRIGY